MKALVVYETMFGNTRTIAEAIADGLARDIEVDVVDVADAPDEVPADVDLVVVGGPTHTFSMSRRSTREDAERRGASRHDLVRGIREWLDGLCRDDDHPQIFAAFDTRVDFPLLPGAASRSATRLLRHHGFTVAEPASFLVLGYEGPLAEGESDRARAWGRTLFSGAAVH